MNNLKGSDLIVDIDKVVPNTWNPKDALDESVENKKNYEAIKKQINDKGLFEAITVREKEDEFEILDGFHRWTACKELGYTEIRINNLGKIDDKLARAITVIKEQKKVNLSEIKVAEIVGWFQEEGSSKGDIMEMLGYDEAQLEEYEKLFDFDWENFDDERDEDEDPKEQEVECPVCGHKFTI